MADEVIEHRFAVDVRPELTIKNISGQITIQAADTSEIRLRATKHGSSRTAENTRVEWDQEGSHVRIQTKGDKGSLFNLIRTVGSVDYDLTVPRDCVIHAEGVSSDIIVKDVAAGVRIQTVSGDARIEHISGEGQITTVSGDVVADELTGMLTIRTTSGDSVVTDSRLHHFNLNSVSGDFYIDTPLERGQHYLVKTVSGDMTLLVPEGIGASIQMKSVSGDIQCALPAQIIKAGRRNWQGLINGGGATVEMNSVSGNMRIASHGAKGSHEESSLSPEDEAWKSDETARVPETAPIPAAVQTAQDSTAGDTSAVLEALELGEISVEEAIAKLDALR